MASGQQPPLPASLPAAPSVDEKVGSGETQAARRRVCLRLTAQHELERPLLSYSPNNRRRARQSALRRAGSHLRCRPRRFRCRRGNGPALTATNTPTSESLAMFKQRRSRCRLVRVVALRCAVRLHISIYMPRCTVLSPDSCALVAEHVRLIIRDHGDMSSRKYRCGVRWLQACCSMPFAEQSLLPAPGTTSVCTWAPSSSCLMPSTSC